MTERVDKPRRIFETSAKKLKIKSQERKNIVFGKLLKKRPLTSILTCNYLNYAPEYIALLVILSFMNFFAAETSIAHFFLRLKSKIIRHL